MVWDRPKEHVFRDAIDSFGLHPRFMIDCLRNAVVGEEFENLKWGEPGEFNKEPGEEGPHATIVKVA